MVSLPERNASISYHLTSQPGAGPRASKGLRETPDLWLHLVAGIPRLLRWWHEAYVDGTQGRTYFTALRCAVPSSVCFWLFLGSPVFSSCSGFSVVLAFFWIFGIYADSPFCPRVASNSQLAQPGWKPCHLGCPRVPASRQLAYPGSKPCQLEAGSSTTSTGSSGTPRFHRPAGTSLRPELPGLRFDRLGGFRGPIPRGTQGLFQDAWNKEFSVREEVRSATR